MSLNFFFPCTSICMQKNIMIPPLTKDISVTKEPHSLINWEHECWMLNAECFGLNANFPEIEFEQETGTSYKSSIWFIPIKK